jgi:3-hydroxy acid dehydrogenase / malonic semialdehyde reductase
LKTALITGATSGIGEACAKVLAASGYHLILTGRRREKLEELARQLQTANGINVHISSFDVRHQQEVEAALKELPSNMFTPDVLINNAGLAAGLGPLHEGKIEHWERMIDTNVKGLLYVSRIIANRMIEAGKGHIINIASIAGKETYANGNVYCATKHAVDSLSKSMRIELLPFGIKVSNIAPGMVETEFSIVRFDGDTERASKVYQGLQALTGEDIAEVIRWIVSLPEHVNINDIVITPKAQANATHVKRS